MKVHLEDVRGVTFRQRGQDQSVLKVQDRRLRDGGVHDGENGLEFKKASEMEVVREHQSENPKLARALETIVPHICANSILDVVHRSARLLDQRFVQDAFYDRVTEVSQVR